MDIAALKEDFVQRFGKQPGRLFFCPGRINLIGEHIDYNGGKVMPCAISLGTWLLLAKNEDRKIRFQCLNFPETADMPLQSSYSKTGKEWFNYPLGMIDALLQQGSEITGLDLLYYGNLPIGAGLSSSASIEVLTGFAFSTISGNGMDRQSIALMAKKVENEFIGVNSGIMDQFAVAKGKAGHAILLDCDTLAHEYLRFETGDYTLVVINTNKTRTLADSKYNERFAQCREALRLLQQEVPIQHLCDLEPKELDKHAHLIGDAVLLRRARHVVTENARVRQAREALIAGDIAMFGRLMFESHDSLREDYEVSGKELDAVVEFSKNYPSCIGARMTGAGFGGCAIALVNEKEFEDYSSRLSDHYAGVVGYRPGIFRSEIGDGVMQVKL